MKEDQLYFRYFENLIHSRYLIFFKDSHDVIVLILQHGLSYPSSNPA